MIKSFQQIYLLHNELESLKNDSKIINEYKIIKQLNQQTTVYISCDNPLAELNLEENENFPPVEVKYIDSDTYNEDKEYWETFFNANSFFEGTKRRLENSFGKYPTVKNEKLPPIVGFYSYKGGVGRSTTLAVFASYHARRTGNKVLIIDCDFEAPGFSNFYGMDEQDLSAKNGVIEYLTDVSYLSDKNLLNLDDYIHTISASASKDPIGYAGDKGGQIYVMKAGNLSVEIIEGNENAPIGLKTHQDHYLQGLARIDFANTERIIKEFTDMLLHICSDKDFAPDVILIDSRTGFNDIFNNICLRLSTLILGFFGTSRQNIPGIYEFLDTIKVMEHSPEVLLVNSICSYVSTSFVEFKEIIAEYDRKTNSEMRNLPIWSIRYDMQLSTIGTSRDKGDDLLIYTDPERSHFPDYQNGSKGDVLLEYLSKQIEKKKDNEVIQNSHTLPNNFEIQPVEKEEILNALLYFFKNENYSHAEGKESLARNQFLEKYFYFRNYLSDLFRKDIFIVRGYKGTGKTLIYNALQNKQFTERLAALYKAEAKYSFLNIVTYNAYPQLKSNNYRHLNVGLPEATYWKRFWVAYTWNEILRQEDFAYKSTLPTIEIGNEEVSRQNIETLIKDANFNIIEKDLKNIDTLLKNKESKLVISFDYLDDIIPLETWGKPNNAIAALMNWAKTLPYSQIYPKIFLRTDLYHKIHDTVNKKGLENKILSLEWGEDELFAYFFKIVYAKCGDAFFYWALLNTKANRESIFSIRTAMQNNNGQISIESKERLAILVDIFFGKNVERLYPNYGETYSWFFNNLKNANGVMSIRPFIALIEKAVENALNDSNPIIDEQTILSGQFFASSSAREFAAHEHFEDIIGEKDATLRMFVDTMRGSNPAIDKYRKMSLDEYNFRQLIIKIYELNGEYDVPREKWQDLIEKLEDIGMIKQNLSFRTSYSFAFLYKFYLRLGGSPERSRR